jgi:hypothetical protein
MRALILLILSISFFAQTGRTQLYLPNAHYYNTSVDKIFMADSAEKGFSKSHLSIRPIRYERTNADSVFSNNNKYYYWITQKLFKENFIIFKGEDFWCSVDPIIDLEGGSDLHPDSSKFIYWNTRGIRVQAKFFAKIAFTSTFYENQAVLPQYVSDFVDQYGELRPVINGYKQEHAVIPGYARTKPFKTIGYDFAFAEGQVSYVPNKWVNFQFGNGNQFIGNGYRSLLLSDFSVNYPFGKIEANLWDDRIQYSAIYAIHQNLYRIPFYESVEPTYERKIGTYHYLDFAVTKNLTLGFFEGALWKRSDSLGTHKPNLLFLNPIPFVNGGIMANQTSGYNAVFGLNAAYNFKSNQVYGQLLLDNKTLGGAQLGIKSYGQFIQGLDIQVEYNWVKHNSYISSEKRYNYSHSNLPLAHPLTAGFNEGIIRVSYEKNGFFLNNKTVYYKQTYSDTNSDGTNILFAQLTSPTNQDQQRNVLHNNLEMGYRFNKAYNLQAFIGWTFREEYLSNQINTTSYVYAGIRTRLRNKTFDF